MLICFIILPLIFMIQSIETTKCNRQLNCLHNGKFNPIHCKCECFFGYFGDVCEYAICKVQPKVCNKISQASCSNPLVFNSCPLICNLPLSSCGFDSCANNGVFDETTCTCVCLSKFTGHRCDILIGQDSSSITTTKTTIKPDDCPIVVCLNNGILNKEKCLCECKGKFTGAICEVSIDNEAQYCHLLDKDLDCLNSYIQQRCPITCSSFSQPSTKITTTPRSTSETPVVPDNCDLNCLNGGTLNEMICECECPPLFIGPTCESKADEPEICSSFQESDCLNDDIKAICPFTCSKILSGF